MKWGALLGYSFLIICIVMFQLAKIKKDNKKEKAALISLSLLGWILATLLMFVPELPGPTQLIDQIFKPLGKLIEK
ncbi:hypothetical protein M670_02029 [Schinkia azotoformans MEV2011]|uniref:Uncharacterized protein n=2 Tax=Schinkia azotoformans TaxID=1454 RepID=K6CAS6_SCHAZ|nr:hypothetical protein [Schinkia azotoformans]EKN68235.1 hypothetical protein BAZO_05730 [Schinkia azotoformans LMG 9581]KEF38815.1 hypothetical protein M670_02029 [Schinkia azotoformans MEV2011]MEC1639601.1 hypothetical protein [Schinkia azotoformans]MEC1693973.1 hypothetical protein [Schinkia azotoformans]MEC1714203.1 hypothetical protein [Schinkia azotoformans]